MREGERKSVLARRNSLRRMHIFNGVKQKDQKLISDIGRFNQICAVSVKVNCTENALYLFAA